PADNVSLAIVIRLYFRLHHSEISGSVHQSRLCDLVAERSCLDSVTPPPRNLIMNLPPRRGIAGEVVTVQSVDLFLSIILYGVGAGLPESKGRGQYFGIGVTWSCSLINNGSPDGIRNVCGEVGRDIHNAGWFRQQPLGVIYPYVPIAIVPDYLMGYDFRLHPECIVCFGGYNGQAQQAKQCKHKSFHFHFSFFDRQYRLSML